MSTFFQNKNKQTKFKCHTIIEHDQTPYTASLKFPGKKVFWGVSYQLHCRANTLLKIDLLTH